jgi:exodeoxyribonuclease VII large subunit
MPASDLTSSTTPTYKVSELAEIVRALLDDMLPSVWVEGEISNFSRPASGHWYFTLKDAQAQLRCAMFKNRNHYIRPIPKEGDRVRVRAKLDFYPGRGDLQLICEALEPAGEGALLAALERLKKKLSAEGLFDSTAKRVLPERPRHIGVITSATGAAVQDIRATLARRWPFATLWLWPVPVQGVEAAPAIIKALQGLPTMAPVEVVILARGGGALEDLMAFNDEALVRAVRACAVPVVTGVGHEVDFTLADFASDLRAPTPTGAAEQVTPKLEDWILHAAETHEALQAAMAEHLQGLRERLTTHSARLHNLHPGRRVQERQQRLDDLTQRMGLAAQRPLALHRQRLNGLAQRLLAGSPQRLAQQRARLNALHAQLTALSPTAVLARGYALALTADGHIATDAALLHAGDALRVQLARGTVQTVVQKTR